MTTRRRKQHTAEQIVRRLRDADAMLNAGKDEVAVLHALEVSQSTFDRWRSQYGGMKAEEAKRLKELWLPAKCRFVLCEQRSDINAAGAASAWSDARLTNWFGSKLLPRTRGVTLSN